MKLSDANILKTGKRQIRAMGDDCNPLCFVWYGCANSKPDGTCQGFVLLDGETRRHLDKVLNEDDALYVGNCVKELQNGTAPETEERLIAEVLRYLSRSETQPRQSGLRAMLEAAHPSNPSTETAQPEPEERASLGFSAMLRASSKGEKAKVVERQNQSSPVIQQPTPIDFEYQLPKICDDTCFIRRHCGAYPAQLGNPCIKQSEQFKNKERILK